METFAQLIAKLIANPRALIAAVNNRAADRPNPFNTPFSGILPVREINSYVAEGNSGTDAPALLVPTGVDGEYPVIGGIVTPDVWKGETDYYTGALLLTQRDQRILRQQLDAATLGRAGGQSVQDVARSYFQNEFVIKGRRSAEAVEALAAARAVTSGVFEYRKGVGVSIDLQLPNKINRQGAQNYVQNPGNFWTDDEIARNKLGTVARTVMNDVTFNAIVGASAETTGIVVEASETTPEGNQLVTVSRLPKTAAGTYDMNARYPDARYRGKQFLVVSQTVDATTINDDGTLTVTKTKLVEDGVIAYHRDAVLGYHHVGPTEEGNGALGRWAGLERPRLTTVRMVLAVNHVPVVEKRDGIFILKTTLTSA